MRIIFIRKEDYWIFPLSVIGVLGVVLLLYAGAWVIRLFCGLIGFSTLYFMLYIIRKNYSRRLAARYLFICLSSAILASAGFYFLTN